MKTFLTWMVQLVLIKNVRLAINLIVDRMATLMDTFKSGSIPTLLSGKNMHCIHLLGLRWRPLPLIHSEQDLRLSSTMEMQRRPL